MTAGGSGAGARPGDAAAWAPGTSGGRQARDNGAQVEVSGSCYIRAFPVRLFKCPGAHSRRGRTALGRYSLLVGVVERQGQPVAVHGAHVAHHLLGAVVGRDEHDLEGGGGLGLLQQLRVEVAEHGSEVAARRAPSGGEVQAHDLVLQGLLGVHAAAIPADQEPAAEHIHHAGTAAPAAGTAPPASPGAPQARSQAPPLPGSHPPSRSATRPRHTAATLPPPPATAAL